MLCKGQIPLNLPLIKGEMLLALRCPIPLTPLPLKGKGGIKFSRGAGAPLRRLPLAGRAISAFESETDCFGRPSAEGLAMTFK